MINPGKKTITLPSGAVCVVRKIAGSDFIAGGLTPIVAELQESARSKTPSTPAQTQRALENMVALTRMIIFRCCGPLRYAGGPTLRIVDKPFDELDDAKETNIELLQQEDADMIVREVNKLSGLTKEAARAAGSFPEEQKAPAGASPDSEGLRLPPDGVAGPESV